jgi:phosphoserine phosphatase
LKPLAKRIGANSIIANKIKVKAGVLTGKIVNKVYGMKDKGKQILELSKRENINLEKSYAFGDTTHDLSMLRVVGNPVVISPKDEIGIIAIQNNWLVCKNPEEFLKNNGVV